MPNTHHAAEKMQQSSHASEENYAPRNAGRGNAGVTGIRK